MESHLEKYKEQLIDFGIAYGGKLAFAILLVLFGPSFIRKLTRIVEKKVDKSSIDKDVKPFVISLINVGLNISILVICAGIIGIQTTSLAIGLALQGSLANFAGGILLLVFKPFQVGNTISTQGFTGTVAAIRIFDTILLTGENKTVIIPNGSLSTSPIINFSEKGNLVVEIPLKISHEHNSEIIKAVVAESMKNVQIILESPCHELIINSISKKYVNYIIKGWVYHKNQGKAISAVIPQLQQEFLKAGIPFSTSLPSVK
jgi:small conductance mechanosensitive channel